jgi:hypothetical protein
MTAHITGFRNEEPWPEVGETLELPDHEAADLIIAGYAEECDATETTERDEATAAQGDEDAGDDGDARPAVDGESTKPQARRTTRKR